MHDPYAGTYHTVSVSFAHLHPLRVEAHSQPSSLDVLGMCCHCLLITYYVPDAMHVLISINPHNNPAEKGYPI